MRRYCLVFTIMVVTMVVISSDSVTPACTTKDNWAVTFYGGRLSGDNLGEALAFKARYADAYLGALALSRRCFDVSEWIGFEVEGQVVQHFGDQDNVETNVLVVLRWLPFFWDSLVDTSVAVGGGISYAFERPKVEAIGHPDTPRLLGYLMIELDFAVNEDADWRMVARLHHRSGANGLFGGRLDASNAWCLGVRYCF